MIKQFISQNITGGGSKINKSYFYFYGPNYIVPKITDSNIEPLNTTNYLFGVSFDYPLDYDDQEQYFKITVNLKLTYLGIDILIPINYTVSMRTIEDTGIGFDRKNFAIPVYLEFPISAIEYIRFNSATIEICNPNPKYDYIAPTDFSLSATAEYVAVNTNLYMDISQFGSYQGIFKADLYNSSVGILVVNNPMTLEFNAYSNPYISKLQTNWAKRADLVSSMTRPRLDLICVDEDGMVSNMYMGVNYSVVSYDVGGEIDTILSAVEQMEIPIITGQTAVNRDTNYIDENLVGSYLIYYINTYLQ